MARTQYPGGKPRRTFCAGHSEKGDGGPVYFAHGYSASRTCAGARHAAQSLSSGWPEARPVGPFGLASAAPRFIAHGHPSFRPPSGYSPTYLHGTPNGYRFPAVLDWTRFSAFHWAQSVELPVGPWRLPRRCFVCGGRREILYRRCCNFPDLPRSFKLGWYGYGSPFTRDNPDHGGGVHGAMQEGDGMV